MRASREKDCVIKVNFFCIKERDKAIKDFDVELKGNTQTLL